jgi:hypothetical protein
MQDRSDWPAWRRCECCKHVELRQNPAAEHGYSVACLNQKCLRGQAGVGKSCSAFEREVGADDDLSRWPPKQPGY